MREGELDEGENRGEAGKQERKINGAGERVSCKVRDTTNH